MNVKTRLMGNAFAQAISRGVLCFQQIIVVPVLLSAWVPEYFGDWMTLTAIPMIFLVADFGCGSAIASSYTIAFASGQHDQANRILVAGGRVLIGIGLALLGVAAGMVGIAVVSGSLTNLSMSPREAASVLMLLTGAAVIGIWQQVIEGLFRAIGKTALFVLVIASGNLLRIAGTVGVVSFGGGASSVAAVYCCVALLVFGANLAYLRRCGPPVRWRGITDLGPERADLLRKAAGYAILPARQAISQQGILLALRTLAGPEQTAVFSALRTVLNVMNQAVGMINQATFPEMQLLYAAKRPGPLQKLYGLTAVLGLTAAGLGAAVLFVFGPTIFSRWTLGKLNFPVEAWYVLLVAVLFNAVWMAMAAAFRIVNQPARFAFFGCIAAGTAALASVPLIRIAEITGACLALLGFEVLMVGYVIWTAPRLVGLTARQVAAVGMNATLGVSRIAIQGLRFRWRQFRN